jgi:hypothetical protein
VSTRLDHKFAKGIVMTGYMHRLMKKIVIAAALAVGSAGIARADDSSMNPFIGDSYAYFNGYNRPANGNPGFDNTPSAWRQANPNGLPERVPQSYSVLGEEWHLTKPSLTNVASDASFRQNHPHGLTETEFQALSSEAPAWQGGGGARAAAVASQGAVAQSAADEALGRSTDFVSVARSIGAQ